MLAIKGSAQNSKVNVYIANEVKRVAQSYSYNIANLNDKLGKDTSEKAE